MANAHPSVEQKREIAQLMFVAEAYLRLAARSAGIHEKFSATIADFASGLSVPEDTKHLILLGAHLASAAIRLASIELALEKAGAPRPIFSECRAFFNGHASFKDSDPRASSLSDWFHVMMRDNTSHEEPLPTETETKKKRWAIRQTFLPETTFADAHAQLTRVADDLRTHIEQAHGLVFPTYS